MKLLIDIGNTASKFGVSSNGELLYLGRMYNKDINYDSIRELSRDVIDVEDILISSVSRRPSEPSFRTPMPSSLGLQWGRT